MARNVARASCRGAPMASSAHNQWPSKIIAHCRRAHHPSPPLSDKRARRARREIASRVIPRLRGPARLAETCVILGVAEAPQGMGATRIVGEIRAGVGAESFQRAYKFAWAGGDVALARKRYSQHAERSRRIGA